MGLSSRLFGFAELGRDIRLARLGLDEQENRAAIAGPSLIDCVSQRSGRPDRAAASFKNDVATRQALACRFTACFQGLAPIHTSEPPRPYRTW